MSREPYTLRVRLQRDGPVHRVVIPCRLGEGQKIQTRCGKRPRDGQKWRRMTEDPVTCRRCE